MKKSKDPLQLDIERRTAALNGKQACVAGKGLEGPVDSRRKSAEYCQSRIADRRNLGSGNVLTGEKGLNQAMWAIRSAMGDDAREPTYIETLPRLGYRWIYKPATGQSDWQRAATLVALAASLGTLAVAVSQFRTGSETSDSHFPQTANRRIRRMYTRIAWIAGFLWIWNVAAE